jgi:hypothetical protein
MWFIGDVHGLFKDYIRILEYVVGKESSIQVGDMGLGFTSRPVLDELPELPDRHKFIRGNHDRPESCRLHPNYLGEFGYDKERDLFFVSGGFSVDRNYRIEGLSWWRDEQLTSAQMIEAYALYSSARPRIMVTHEAPDSVVQAAPFLIWSGMTHTATGMFLDRLWRLHQPQLWIAGHYHKDADLKLEGTRFRLLPELGVFHLEE